MTEQPDTQTADQAAAMRDEDGQIRPEFIARVSEAIERGDAAFLHDLAGDMHEADLGELVEALPAELRPKLVELAGAAFHFSALTEVDEGVRDEILEELK